MAIPYYTPPEYGPVATNNNNANVQNRNHPNQNAQVINVHNNNVRNNNHNRPVEHLPVGFFQQLALELSSVLFNPQVRPERDPLGTPPVNRRSHLQQAAEAGPSTPPRSPRLPLPDIIQCHAQLAFNFCATATNNATNNSGNIHHDFTRRDELPVPVPTDEIVHLEFKIGVECYERTGRDLRDIADDLERNYNRQNRRPLRRSGFRLSLDMDVMDLKVAVPALAFLGAFSYCYFFRR